MFPMKNSRFGLVVICVLLSLVTIPPMIEAPLAATPAAEYVFDIVPWTNGEVPYKFSAEVTDDHRKMMETEMEVWQNAMTIADPAGGPARKYIRFKECLNCTKDYIFIRYSKPDEGGNFCPVGMDNKNNYNDMYINIAVFGSKKYGPNTLRHELGHCLGLWHDFNRYDADSWLVEYPDEDGDDFQECPGNQHGTFAFCYRGNSQIPMLGNYAYDSIMHYNYDNVTDRLGNYFGRYNLDEGYRPPLIAPQDKSRLLQYYAWSMNNKWRFFESLSTLPSNPDALPNPYLTGDPVNGGIRAIGTPAIAFQSPGNFDIFTRGSNSHLYWKAYRNYKDDVWVSLGCCYESDPSAVSNQKGELDVVAIGEIDPAGIGANPGKLIYDHYENGRWQKPVYVLEGYPEGGLKKASSCPDPDYCTEYIGPAIDSRLARSLDVFVVQKDGLLSMTTFYKDTWSKWIKFGGNYPGGSYNVTARPAVVALGKTILQLAINESDYNLYEPRLVITPLIFTLGSKTATTAYQAPPALTTRDDPNSQYRVLITNVGGRISHKFAGGAWIDIGGIPKPGTGPSAVATGSYGAYIVMNGEDAKGCTIGCKYNAPSPNQMIQPGGLWLREFE